MEPAKLTVQEGALFIPAAQPLARLAFYLLEPESDDGLVTWNLIEAGLSAGETYPVYRVMNTRDAPAGAVASPARTSVASCQLPVQRASC